MHTVTVLDGVLWDLTDWKDRHNGTRHPFLSILQDMVNPLHLCVSFATDPASVNAEKFTEGRIVTSSLLLGDHQYRRHYLEVKARFGPLFWQGMTRTAEAITESWTSLVSFTVHSIEYHHLPIIANKRSQRVATHSYMYIARARHLRHHEALIRTRARAGILKEAGKYVSRFFFIGIEGDGAGVRKSHRAEAVVRRQAIRHKIFGNIKPGPTGLKLKSLDSRSAFFSCDEAGPCVCCGAK